MKLRFLILLITFFLILIIISIFLLKDYSKIEALIKIDEKEILVEIADTPAERTKGLANRKSLPENQGMLFIFEEPGYYSFWMKDTLIPLDIVWLKDNKIIETTENVTPEDYNPPRRLSPKNEIDSVLEVNAGLVKNLNIKLGDKIILEY